MELKKIALITGASTGIGREIAIELAKTKTHVVLVGRTNSELDKTKEIITNNKGSAEVFLIDLSDISSISLLENFIKEKTNRLDIIVNVTGVWHGVNEVFANKMFEQFSKQIILDTYNVGLIAPTLLVHTFIPLMPKNSKIINISGTFENGAKGWLPYYVSKKAIEDLTIGLAEELKDKQIQVNAISPSDTATEAYKKYFPQYIDEAIDPNIIAKYVTYLCSNSADNITGKVFVMKKGQEPYEGFHT